MKSTLSDFSKVELNKNKENTTTGKIVHEQYDKIKNLSQSEASSMLMNEVFRQKQNGTFDFEGLSRQVESLKGYLPEKDYQNLQRMLASLK